MENHVPGLHGWIPWTPFSDLISLSIDDALKRELITNAKRDYFWPSIDYVRRQQPVAVIGST
jgi:hypothetical protein